MLPEVQGFLAFTAASPSAFHSCANACRALEAAGYAPLNEFEPWNIAPGGRYFVTRNLSSVIAFAVPRRGAAPFQIVASHSDSPAFKLKPHAGEDALGHYARLNVERYGGMIMSTWLDRPLSIAGRVMVRMPDGVEARLIDLGRDAALIPNMPIHFCREINDGFKFNPQVDLLPLYGDGQARDGLMAEVGQRVGAAQEDILAADLFLYNRMAGTVWGPREEFFSCPRIDDLECAYTSLQAFLAAQVGEHVNVYALFDNEEVGSGTKQGAASTFLADVLFRLSAALGATDSQTRALTAASFMVSADNAHAVHPNHPEKYDADNRAYMNGGVVIKHNANQKYTTDALSAALFSDICRMAEAPVQHFANRSDLPGGSTLGNIANTQVSMNTVDIGLAQLAMHSAYETAGCQDIPVMIAALRRFYETEVRITADGRYCLG